MKVDYVLLGLGVASSIIGLLLIVLGNVPPWNKDNFVYVMGVMTLLSSILIYCLGVLEYWRRRQEESRLS